MTTFLENLDEYILGTTKEPLLRIGEQENQTVCVHMIQQAEFYLDILSHDLEPAIYDTEECCQVIENLALRSRYSQIRILLHDAQKVVRRGHELIYLGKRLGSLIQFRQLAPIYQNRVETFMLVDRVGFMHREFKDALRITANFCDGKQVKVLTKVFNQLWEDSEPDPNTSVLIL